jgi:Flp pilus assembly pilin Flp
MRIHLRRESGQTMPESAGVLGVITLGIVVAIGALSGSIARALGTVLSAIG